MKSLNISTIAAISIVVGIAVLDIKFLSYYVTGSVALYSDALESIINVVTAVLALFAVRLSAKPADAALPYGYHKVEYLSAVIVDALIIVAAVLIFQKAYEGYLAPKPLEAPVLGLAINALATVINATWCWVLINQGRLRHSPALAADGQHLRTDVVSSGGVLIGVVLATLTGWSILDPILAALVALNILWSGSGLLKGSVEGLMDVAVPQETQAHIQAIIASSAGGAIQAHDIRARQAGRVLFVEFHLVVPSQMEIEDAHAICDRIEDNLKTALGEVVTTIHLEPERKAKEIGSLAL